MTPEQKRELAAHMKQLNEAARKKQLDDEFADALRAKFGRKEND